MAKKVKAVAVCTPKSLPEDQQEEAARRAVAICPTNAPKMELPPNAVAFSGAGALKAMQEVLSTSSRLAVTKWWGAGGVDLTVGFMDNPTEGFKNLFLAHANSWSEWANIKFRWTQTDPQVRLLRQRGQGYWSYIGTDILGIPQDQPTMNLDSFTERTSDAMWRQIARHEVGHSLGCHHEQLRQAIVSRIDARKAIAYFRQTSGWDEQTTRFNVLTPLEERSVMASVNTDEVSVMAYSLPASIMKDGRAVPGGRDLSETDKAFIATVYPKTTTPPPPPDVGSIVELIGVDSNNREIRRFKVVA